MRARAYCGLTLLLGGSFLGLCGVLWQSGLLVGQEPKPARRPAVLDFDPAAEEAKSARAVRDFAQAKDTDEERLRAAKDIGVVAKEDGQLLLSVFRNKKESDAIRIVALQKSPVSEPVVKEAATVVKERQGKYQLRLECVGYLHTAESSDHAGHMTEKEITPALRSALEDPDAKVRYRAAGYLVQSQDAEARRLFQRTLDSGSAYPPFPKADAIRYLAAYRSPEDYRTFQVHLADKDAVVRAAAAEALTADKERAKQVLDWLEKTGEGAQAKIAVLRGLRANQPKDFPHHALPFVARAEEPAAVRAFAVEELAKVLRRHPGYFTDEDRKRASAIIGGLAKEAPKPLQDAAILYLKVEAQLAEDGRE
jgi:hypothetical protein